VRERRGEDSSAGERSLATRAVLVAAVVAEGRAGGEDCWRRREDVVRNRRLVCRCREGADIDAARLAPALRVDDMMW
jgi:hypothetical protein